MPATPGLLPFRNDHDAFWFTTASQFGNVVRRFYANPVGPVFHQVAGTTPLTGQGPRAVSVQPGRDCGADPAAGTSDQRYFCFTH